MFRASPIGQIVPITGNDPRRGESYEHYAFLPDPLPDDVALSTATWTDVSGAMHALGRLDEASRLLPVTSLLRRPALRREAVSTSALEGTYAAFEEVLEAEADADEPKSPEV